MTNISEMIIVKSDSSMCRSLLLLLNSEKVMFLPKASA